MTTHIDRYSSGTGKVIERGDYIKVDGKTARYKVLDIYEQNGQTYVDAYGGSKGRLLTRTFHVDRCARSTRGQDNNETYRESIAEVSRASKSKRRGWA